MKVSKWPTHALGDLVSFKSGGTPSRERMDFWNGCIPWFSGKDLKALRLHDSIEHISAHAVGKGTRTTPKGTILVLVRGMTLMKEVPVGLLHRDAAFNQDIKGIVTNDGSLDPEFLAYYLRAENQRIRNSVTVAGHGTGRLPLEALEEYPVPLPPVPEQRKIADILSTWDEALEKFDALIAAKDRQKQALMQQLLTGKTRVKGANGKWKKVRMGDVLERVFRPIDWHADLPLNLVSLRRRCGGLFRRPDVKGSEYKTQDLHEIRAGDFLISKRQVVHGAWGYVTPEFEGGHVSKEYAILDNRAPNKLHMPFFAWLAQTRRLIRLARVSSTGVHIEKLIFDPVVFLRESIRIPADLAEQQRIATILDTADQELTLLRTQRQTLDQQKRGLMQRLLTGKTRVKS
jgi:type I restriction enzyme, S subunit